MVNGTPIPLLDVRQLNKHFHMHLVDGRVIKPFSDISFTVHKGTLFMISGKSGAGKTTILKCIYRTYLTTSGEIWYDSQQFGRINIAQVSEDLVIQLREREVGYCSQFLKVLPRVPALDVTAEPLIRCGTPREEARATAEQWLRRLGIEESRWQASPVTFSGGEQQRLNIARAFIAAPRLLLLDEPTASLDAVSKTIVLEMIREARAAGITIVAVSHDTAAIAPIADKVYAVEASTLHTHQE
jgi:alpha-D-ribose 1-methylphosphonate 5-triphosphate synthase subunit PhnL